MANFTRVLTTTAVVAVLAAGAYWVLLRTPTTAATAPVAVEKREPNVVRFPEGARQLESIRVTEIQAAPVPLAEPLNGRLAYNENATVRVSSPIAGRIVSLKLQPGDTVRAGDTLAVLDSPELAAAIADREKAVTDQERKRLARDRAKTLFDGGVLAGKEFENAQAEYDLARAEERRAALRLKNLVPAGGVSSGFPLRASMNGVIADRKANPGLEVRPEMADPLFIVTDPSRLWVIVDVPERNLASVRVGLQASVEVDAYPGERFPARIERVGATVDPVTRRVPVRAELPNGSLRLKPEMYARVSLIADESKVVAKVPNGALVTQGVNSYVFVERSPGVFVRRRVDLAFQDREWSYVGEAIKAGERIVTSGALLLNSELAETQ